MSKLFSCFACTEKRKRRKYGDDLEDDKMPKEKKSKKGLKQKGRKDNNSEPLNNQVIIRPKDHNLENTTDAKHFEISSGGDHSVAPKMTNDGGAEDISRSHEPHSNDPAIKESQGKERSAVPQIQINNGGNSRARSSSDSSRGNSSDAGSCLTDSDLNISEAVFVTEEGPRVGSLGASLSRMGLQTMRATTENERRLERELLDRASVNSWNKNTSTSSDPRLSVDVGKVSKEERN